MKNQDYTRKEKETTLVFNEEEGQATIWSASDMFERKMTALGLNGENYGGGMRWLIPKGWIKVRKKRELSEERKNVLRERLNKSLKRAK